MQYEKEGYIVYEPNKKPKAERVVINIVLSLFLIVYGSYGVYVNDFYIPSKRNDGVHLNAEAAWLAYGACVCGALVMLSAVVDHYDRRNNENKYKLFAKYFRRLGWILLCIAFVYQFFHAMQ